jgi:hypothetical protein
MAKHQLTLKIKYESLPERCEICHKADLFDSQTGYCSRCAVLIENIKSQENRRVQNIRYPYEIASVRFTSLLASQRWRRSIAKVPEFTIEIDDSRLTIRNNSFGFNRIIVGWFWIFFT